MPRLVASAFASTLLCLGGAASAQQITPETLRAALSGNTVTFVIPGGDPANVYFAGDGTVKVDIRGQRPFSDTGRWTVNGNQYCTKYPKLRSGHEACYAVEQLSGEDISAKDASGVTTHGKLRKGNAAGL